MTRNDSVLTAITIRFCLDGNIVIDTQYFDLRVWNFLCAV